MLDLRGYKYLEYNGSMSDIERNQAVKAFEMQDDVHVMLLSNVGTTGLNLPMASVVIFLVCALPNTHSAQLTVVGFVFGRVDYGQARKKSKQLDDAFAPGKSSLLTSTTYWPQTQRTRSYLGMLPAKLPWRTNYLSRERS